METLQKILPWMVALPWIPKVLISAIIILMAMFFLVMLWVPQRTEPTPIEREVAHRFTWIADNLKSEPLLITAAWEASNAITGGGGRFRPTAPEFKDIALASLVARSNADSSQERVVRDLELLLAKVPQSDMGGESVAADLAKQLKTSASLLGKDTQHFIQGTRRDEAASRP